MGFHQPMKLNDTQIVDLRGNVLVNQLGKPLLLKDIITEVILADTPDDKNSQDLAGNKLYRYELAKRVLADELDEDELAYVKARASVLCSSLVFGRLLETLKQEA